MPRKNGKKPGITKLGVGVTKTYAQAWREKNPLLTVNVSRAVHDELKRRAGVERRSMSQYVALLLENLMTELSDNGA